MGFRPFLRNKRTEATRNFLIIQWKEIMFLKIFFWVISYVKTLILGIFLSIIGKEASFCCVAHDPRQLCYLYESVITGQMKQHGDVCFHINPSLFLELQVWTHDLLRIGHLCNLHIHKYFCKEKNNASVLQWSSE